MQLQIKFPLIVQAYIEDEIPRININWIKVTPKLVVTTITFI